MYPHFMQGSLNRKLYKIVPARLILLQAIFLLERGFLFVFGFEACF